MGLPVQFKRQTPHSHQILIKHWGKDLPEKPQTTTMSTEFQRVVGALGKEN